MTWIRIHFFQCGSRIRISITIKWILSTGVNIYIKQSPDAWLINYPVNRKRQLTGKPGGFLLSREKNGSG